MDRICGPPVIQREEPRVPKITEQTVKGLKPTGQRYWRNDDELKGFAVRVNSTGRAMFCFRYRIGRAQSTFTIGPATAMTAAQARKRAKELAVEVANGRDPQDAKRAQREVPLFKMFAQQYLDMTMKASKGQDEAKIRDVLNPRWGSRPISAIRTTDVRQLLTSLRERKKPAANATVNRYRSLLVTIFNRAIEHGVLTTNPATPVPRLEENNKRDRYLSPDEFSAFLHALDAQPRNAANALRLLVFTGTRKNNVMRMKWDDVDLVNNVWVIPKPKGGKRQRVPLNDAASRVLHNQKQLREAENPFVFPGNTRGTCITTVHNVWVKVRDDLGLKDCRVHDLRHTFASYVVMETRDLPGVSKLLGHHSPIMTARYAHHADNHLHRATASLDSVVASLPAPVKKDAVAQ